MDPAVVYEEIRSMQRKMDIMSKKMDKIDRQTAETSSLVNATAIMLKTIDDTLRKSANSITIIVRMVSGLTGMSSTNLNELLRETNALLAPVKPNPVWNSELSSLAGYQPMHALKLMLTELIQIIDKHRLDIVKCQSEIVPITAPSSSLSSVPCTMTNTIESSQNERSAVLSVENEESSLVSDTLSQNNNSEILTVHFDENYGVSSTNIAPLQNNISNSKNKNEEDEGALRRKYKNKYRYLNVSQALSTEPKKNIICRDSNYIPEPYRNTLFKNIKSVRIINSQTNKSVIKPLSFIHPRIVIKKIDVANCAAVAPRIKNDNGNSLQSRSPSNNHSASHDECKVINKRRNIRNSKITNKKSIKFQNQVMKSNRKSLRITTSEIKSTSKDKKNLKKPLKKKLE